jgi:serine/threonine protein kinase
MRIMPLSSLTRPTSILTARMSASVRQPERGTSMFVSPLQPKRFGRYLLHERIGRGGFADLFRATVQGLEGFTKQVAIKRIFPHLIEDREFTRMFIDEAKLSAQLVHRNVVQIHELGSVDGILFIAMEFVDGRDLSQVIQRLSTLGKSMPVEIAAYILACICQGLHYAHTKKDGQGLPLNIIHRDVSPSNMLFSWEGDVKLADFGIAKAAGSSEETRSGVLRGKFSYMSPEQLQGQSDRRSDVFSVGIVLWELLVGHRLFSGETEWQIIKLITNGQIPRAADQASVPDELQQILDRSLTLEKDARFQTADEMADSLLTFIHRAGLRAGARELSTFLEELYQQDTFVQAPEMPVQGRISRVAATPRTSTKGDYLFRGIELNSEGEDTKILILFPEIAGPDLYNFPLLCWPGAYIVAYNLQLNNRLKDGSVIFEASKRSDLILDMECFTVEDRRLGGGETPIVADATKHEVEALVAAVGGAVQRNLDNVSSPEPLPSATSCEIDPDLVTATERQTLPPASLESLRKKDPQR